MPRPREPREDATERMHAYLRSQPKRVQVMPAYLKIYEEAIAKTHWIYDPSIKRWQSPEEFLALEERISGGEPNRLARLQVKDPLEGIEAGYLQLQQLKERMEIFAKRVVAYYRKK